jgi:hypothetical protein
MVAERNRTPATGGKAAGGREPPNGSGSTSTESVLDDAIADLRPLVDLVEKPAMAEVYLAALDEGRTVPSLLDEAAVTKSTLYDYVDALQRAGLLAPVGERNGAVVYRATEFTFTLETDQGSVTVDPELIRVLSRRESDREIGSFLDDHGVGALAILVDLVHEQDRGEVTTRTIAKRLDLPRGRTYDVVEAIQRTLGLGDDPETFRADDLDESERDALLDR